MMKVMVNLSWACNLDNCPHCWVRQVIPDRQARQGEHNAEEWVAALLALPESVIDFVGGEPTAFEGLRDVIEGISSKHKWAVTSNVQGKSWGTLLPRLPQCVSYTCSWHPSGEIDFDTFASRVSVLNEAYPTSVNIVESEKDADDWAAVFRGRSIHCSVSPHENPTTIDGYPGWEFSCNAGVSHIVIDPQGTVYPCLSCLRSRRRRAFVLGNLFKGLVLPQARRKCFLACDVYFILKHFHNSGDMFGVDVEVLERPDGAKDLAVAHARRRPSVVSGAEPPVGSGAEP